MLTSSRKHHLTGVVHCQHQQFQLNSSPIKSWSKSTMQAIKSYTIQMSFTCSIHAEIGRTHDSEVKEITTDNAVLTKKVGGNGSWMKRIRCDLHTLILFKKTTTLLLFLKEMSALLFLKWIKSLSSTYNRNSCEASTKSFCKPGNIS